MASFDTTRPAAGLSAGNLSGFVVRAIGAFYDWNDARMTRNALSKLSARELDDIGLSVGDINLVAARRTR